MKKHQRSIFFGIFMGLISLSSIIGLQINDSHIGHGQEINLIDQSGTKLYSTYYEPLPQKDIGMGTIILSGFGSDQIGMQNIVSEIQEMGFHVFVFDFSGHGRSGGTLGFDNAQTDELAKQTLLAKQKFMEMSGLTSENLMMVGHSMGARVAIQSQTMDSDPVSSLFLLGTSISLVENVQSSFFTGVEDSDISWIRSLNATNPACDIGMVSGGWDDVLTPDAAQLLQNKLITGNSSKKGTQEGLEYRRDLQIIPRVFHNYEVYSAKCMKAMKNWISSHQIQSEGIENKPKKTQIRISLWIAFIVSLPLGIIFTIMADNETPKHKRGGDKNKNLSEKPINEKTKEKKEIKKEKEEKGKKEIQEQKDIQKEKGTKLSERNGIMIQNIDNFLKYKLFLWVPAILVGIILCALFFIIPLGLPVFNMVYVGFIGGNGVLLLYSYKKGKLKGIKNSFNPRILQDLSNYKEKAIKNQSQRRKTVIGISIYIIITLLSVLFARSGIYFVFPANQRIFWLFLFSGFIGLGFYFGWEEQDAIKRMRIPNKKKNKSKINLNLIGLLPFFIFTVFFAILGSFSGMIGGIHGLIILGLSLLLGDFLKKQDFPNFLIAILQAFYLQLLILPQGVLFGL